MAFEKDYYNEEREDTVPAAYWATEQVVIRRLWGNDVARNRCDFTYCVSKSKAKWKSGKHLQKNIRLTKVNAQGMPEPLYVDVSANINAQIEAYVLTIPGWEGTPQKNEN
ncbi:hypothetical protein CCP3SC15_300019 [Gammaproteobacteria bacterium]